MISKEVILKRIGQTELGENVITDKETPFIGVAVAKVTRGNEEETHVAMQFSKKDHEAYVIIDPEAHRGLIRELIEIYAYEVPAEDKSDKVLFVPVLDIASANTKQIEAEFAKYGKTKEDVDTMPDLAAKRANLVIARAEYVDLKLIELGVTEADLKGLDAEAKIEKMKELAKK